MYARFDTALRQALRSEFALFGVSDRSVATAAARRAAVDNRVKAMNEATLGNVSFAYMHDTASTRFHEDCELMASGRPPRHHSVGYYLKTATAYRHADTDSHVRSLEEKSWLGKSAVAA